MRSARLAILLALVALFAGCREESPATGPAPIAGEGPSDRTLARGSEPTAPKDGLSAETLARISEATVLVEVWYREMGPEGKEVGPSLGTGFVVSEDGLIITNHHVVDSILVYDPHEGRQVEDATRAFDRRLFVLSSIKVRLHSGTDRSRQLDAQVLATRDDPHDLALLRTHPAAPLAALPIADAIVDPTLAPSPQLTERVWAIGYPLGHQVEDALETLKMARNPHGLDLSIREGTVSSLRKDPDGRVVLEHTCLIDHGNSGGPLVDARGRVVGVNTWGIGKVAYAIPVEAVLTEFKETLRLHGELTTKRQNPPRTLVVEPAGKTGETTFKNIQDALAAARPGDEVVLPEGEVKGSGEIVVPAGVRLRGAGVGRTKLGFPDGGSRLRIGGDGYSEVSDMSIDFLAGEFAVPERASAETFVHDIEVTGTAKVQVGDGASPSLIGVTIYVDGSEEVPDFVLLGPAGKPRAERCNARLIRLKGSSGRLDGCLARTSIVISGGADPLIRGCHSDMLDGGTRLHVRDARGTYVNNLLGVGNVADAGSVTRWIDNIIVCALTGRCLRVEGDAEIRGNRFTTHDDSAVLVLGSAVLKGNAVLFSGITWSGPPDEKEKKRRAAVVYGFSTSGEGSRLEYGGNHFHNWADWGNPVGEENGGPAPRNLGGNETTLNDHSTPGGDGR